MEKVLTVDEIYQCLGLLSGLSQTNKDTNKQETIVLGFVNEKGISEGMRRIANKTTKKLTENYPLDQIKQIQSLSFADLYDGKLPDEYEQNTIDDNKLAILKQSKLNELVTNKVTIVFEELPDFKILDDRLEDRKEELSHNYTFIFEKLFLNY